MNPKPLRILLSAYQCGPGMGSVSQIGWEWYSRMSRLASITLVTHVRNRECLEAAGAPLPGTEIIYIDTEWFAGTSIVSPCACSLEASTRSFFFRRWISTTSTPSRCGNCGSATRSGTLRTP